MRLLFESDPQRIRIALLEGERLAELQVEDHQRSRVGDVYLGRVRRLAPAIDAAFVDIGLERNAFLHKNDFGLEPGTQLEVHQPLVVQVFRDAVAGKGARVRSGASLPGRYLVLLASGEGVAVSQRIEDEAERLRLIEIVERVGDSKVGWIARTAARDVDAARLEAEATSLSALWKGIERQAASTRPPQRLHQELVSTERWLRDRADDSVREIWVDSESLEKEIRSGLETVAPSLLDRLHRHDGPESLFTRFGVERQLENLRDRRVRLPSGGSLVIESTEALVAIDVNSGRDLEAGSLEETALLTNREAAREVARQIRLRDLSGIIVIDFIDLENEAAWEDVREALERELAKDRVASQLEGPLPFGLFALTRKRGRRHLLRQLTVRCPECHGSGHVLSPLEVGTAAGRELMRRDVSQPGARWRLRLHPDVAASLEVEAPWVLEQLASRFGERLEVESSPEVERSAFAVEETDS